MAIITPPSDSYDEPRTMTLAYFSNEFPPDDLEDLARRLYNQSKDKKHHILARLLEETTSALRSEINQLSTEIKSHFPPFESILNLVAFPKLRKGRLSGSIDGVLLVVIELAAFVGHHEASSTDFDFDPISTSLAGISIGLLAAATVSLSRKLDDIPIAAAQVVRAAFRLGILVEEVSANLQPRNLADTDELESWAFVLPDLNPAEAQTELDRFHLDERTPKASQIFISATSKTSITISGPPARLKHILLVSDYFRDRKFVPLPVYTGLCHAGHIYRYEHVRTIVQTVSESFLSSRPIPRIPIFSTSTGKHFVSKTPVELLENIVWEILTQQIQWDNVVDEVIARARDMQASEFRALIFRQTLPINDVLTSLNSELKQVETKTTDLVSWITQTPIGTLAPSSTSKSKIAIVGMSCRLPGGATDTEKFWELLEAGLDVHRRIPPDRFDVDTHWDPDGNRVNASHTQYGCFIDEPGLFDAPFFNMSPREALETDPMQRLILVTAYEALERAGYVANRTPSTNLHRIGTFYGQASDDYREVNTAQNIGTYFITGGCRAFGPGRINYFFKFSGPSFSIDTACSSSLATIHAACVSLWNGETDTVVAGGTNVLTNSDAFTGLSKGHFLTKTPNACKTWDSEADGYCRADGVVSVVLKRLEDAEADNDNILGVILGAGTNHSADAISITHPHAGAQSFLSRQVLSQAGVDPLDVSFVEMHGTGTQAGDTIEIQSVIDVYAPLKRRRSSRNPLHIGAVKANVGHGEAVAGATALLKVLLCLEKEALPPHVGIKHSLNPAFPKDLDKRNLKIPLEKTPWPRVLGKTRIAAVNNFSAAGGNSTVLLEEAPIKRTTGSDPRNFHIFNVSAKSKISLRGNLERLIAYLERNPDISPADLSYSTTARRSHHNHRISVAYTGVSELKKKLSVHLESVDSLKPIPATGPPQVAFTFTGQGASYKSSNLELYHDSPFFRSQILQLDSLAQQQGFPSFISVIDGTHNKDYNHSPVVTQLALVATEIALARYWMSLGVKPEVVVGHSLGEYAALNIAGVISASDAIFLVGSRAALLEKKCQIGSHKMLAVRANLEQIKNSVGNQPYEVACINGPNETVLSGEVDHLDVVSKVIEKAGYKTFSLDVAFAFHSAQTDPILDELEALTQSAVMFQAPNLPVISPLLGKVIFDEKTVNAKYIRRSTREVVNFVAALKQAQSISTIDETTVWVEIGPHPVSIGFIRSTLSAINAAVPSLRRDESNWATITKSLTVLHTSGIDIGWNEYHRPFERALRLLDLPTYSWNEKTYWIPYNGDWALTKGNTFYDDEKKSRPAAVAPSRISELRTSSVQNVVEEEFNGTMGKVVVRSDLMQPELFSAANGHRMNGCGVVTSSIHADIAYTLGKYLHNKLKPNVKSVDIDVANLVVTKGLVAQKNTKAPQFIQITIEASDIGSGVAVLTWQNVRSDNTLDEPFATANLYYSNATQWLKSWIPTTHLIQGRIEMLEDLAGRGIANRFTRNMAYRLFANNLVDYADKYRGMQSVVLYQLEAFADVLLTAEKSGTWTVPPHFIDSVAHLAGFVMNVSDAVDTSTNFCVTPGWDSMRFARPLVPGSRYRSYVKMIPTEEDESVYLGDVYILQDDSIVGVVRAIKFRRYPRILLDRFFSAPDENMPQKHSSTKLTTQQAAPKAVHAQALETPAVVARSNQPAAGPAIGLPTEVANTHLAQTASMIEPKTSKLAKPSAEIAHSDSESTAGKALKIIADETGIDVAEITEDASFSNLGVDSLMSLVIAEKFRSLLGVTVSGSLFLEYPTVGDLKAWLLEYYD
ncbi:uncharacterized protein PV09_03835 [Verruconis gallopava]|uniref:Uncharacterized protein n=1 Tax=Verruconis gallopava TaxID=253628 RepID=A0A0D2AFP2_9PEZI|nr:uncharacterized protein PV09_03835 [Verruconis gallopava]KIW05310.1 hypothetical protein PV09_03835 [Verruconis gallopava]